MKYTVILLFFFQHAFGAIERIHGSTNTFLHKSPGLSIKRVVKFTGFTFHENLSSYMGEAVRQKSKSIKKDDELNIKIVDVQVIKMHGPSSVDGRIGYIVKTRVDRYFLKYQVCIKVSEGMVEPADFLRKLSAYQSQHGLSTQFVSPSSSEIYSTMDASGADNAMDRYFQGLQSSPNLSEVSPQDIWITVQVHPDTEMWHRVHQRFTFCVHTFNYTVIEHTSL